jgi:hypothetical protein
MQLDEFARDRGVEMAPVDQLAGLAVKVGLPSGWDILESAVGVRVWICSADPFFDEFCANAVLTMHRIGVALDVKEVFAMLVEQQVFSVPKCCETRCELAVSTDGPGVAGTLVLEIDSHLGRIDSVSRTRIIPRMDETLIAQLTSTALVDSPAGTEGSWLTVRASDSAASGLASSAVTGAWTRGGLVDGT